MSAPRPTRSQPPPLLLDVVFDAAAAKARPRGQSRRRDLALAWALAAAVHAAVWLVAARSGPSLEAWAANVAVLVHHELTEHLPTEIEATPPPPAAEEEPPPPPVADEAPAPVPAPRAERTVARAPEPASAVLPAESAQAAPIVAHEPSPDAPVDLTDTPFVTGNASAYAGGTTRATGTSRVAVPASALQAAPANDAAQGSGQSSRAAPVQLEASEWRCPWPQSALDAEIYEQAVVLRVVVRADGSVERATLLDDPGFGFGAAALACARATRFTPARDAAGRLITASSPPIRVRFTR